MLSARREAVQRAWVSFADDGKPEHNGWQATTDWRGEPHVRLHGGGEVEVSTATVSTATVRTAQGHE